MSVAGGKEEEDSITCDAQFLIISYKSELVSLTNQPPQLYLSSLHILYICACTVHTHYIIEALVVKRTTYIMHVHMYMPLKYLFCACACSTMCSWARGFSATPLSMNVCSLPSMIFTRCSSPWEGGGGGEGGGEGEEGRGGEGEEGGRDYHS